MQEDYEWTLSGSEVVNLFSVDLYSARLCGFVRFWASLHIVVLQKRRGPKTTLGPPDARPKRAILTWTRRASHSSRRTDIDGNAARDGQNIARHAISDYISLKTLLLVI
jgi:hypothetical protein